MSTPNPTPRPTPPTLSAEQAEALREDFEAARYTQEGLAEVFSASALEELAGENPVPVRREITHMRRGALPPAALLMDLLRLGGTATATQIDAALPRTTADTLAAIGLIAPSSCVATGSATSAEWPSCETAPTTFRALVDLRPYEAEDDAGEFRWWIASDLTEIARGCALPPDHVLGISGSTTTLVGITPRARVDSVLDLGCGCGIQALHAARHARRVVATDVLERALAFTRFNATLNQATLPSGTTIETRLGSMLAPVAGEQFDLVVSNPPFVITPRTEDAEVMTYRDGGREGDALVGELIASLHTVLAPSGRAALLANWEITEGVAWHERVSTWLAHSPLSAVVIERTVESPARYAATWLRDGGLTPTHPEWATRTEEWLNDFDSRAVTGIGFGHVLVQQAPAPTTPNPTEQAGANEPTSAPARLFEHVETTGHGPLGPRYGAMLEAITTLSGMSNEEMRDLAVAIAPDVVERRHFTPGAEDPLLIDLVQGGGLGRTLPLDTHTAAMVGVLTGEYPLGILLDAYCALIQASDGEADAGWATIDATVLDQIRSLITWGFLSLNAQ